MEEKKKKKEHQAFQGHSCSAQAFETRPCRSLVPLRKQLARALKAPSPIQQAFAASSVLAKVSQVMLLDRQTKDVLHRAQKRELRLEHQDDGWMSE